MHAQYTGPLATKSTLGTRKPSSASLIPSLGPTCPILSQVCMELGWQGAKDFPIPKCVVSVTGTSSAKLLCLQKLWCGWSTDQFDASAPFSCFFGAEFWKDSSISSAMSAAMSVRYGDRP
eukprot:scaffold10074_cov19-Tisochrysis_lutea.AAC.1